MNGKPISLWLYIVDTYIQTRAPEVPLSGVEDHYIGPLRVKSYSLRYILNLITEYSGVVARNAQHVCLLSLYLCEKNAIAERNQATCLRYIAAEI